MIPVEDMSLEDIAEELGELRAFLQCLKSREAQLREAVLTRRPNRSIKGANFELSLRFGTSRRIDRSRLPSRILQNNLYWLETLTITVLTRPRGKLDPVAAPRHIETLTHHTG